ncbi:MAG: 50S ribosomal protein L30 [bacterium]
MHNIKITLKKSYIGRPKKHRIILDSLALRKINKTVIVPDNAQMRGAIKKVSHLVDVSFEESA